MLATDRPDQCQDRRHNIPMPICRAEEFVENPIAEGLAISWGGKRKAHSPLGAGRDWKSLGAFNPNDQVRALGNWQMTALKDGLLWVR